MSDDYYGDNDHNETLGKAKAGPIADGLASPRTNGASGAGGLITVEPIRASEMQASYAQELEAPPSGGGYGTMMTCLGNGCGALGMIPGCFCFPNPFQEISQGYVGLVSRFGRIYRTVDPGLVKVNPFTENVRHVDVRIQTVSIPRQTIMTRDNVNVELESVLYYHITNPYKAAFGIADVETALLERAQTTLRNVAGNRVLQSILTEREAVAAEIEQQVETVSETWGVRIESILIKDIIFSEELQQSLSAAAQARRLGESKVVAARAEVDAAKLLREAADILSSPAAIQIRQLEALQNMAKSASSKVVFVPMSLQSMGSAQANILAEHGEASTSGLGGGGIDVARINATERI